MKKYLEVGEIVGTHGIAGELRVNPWADGPEFLTRFKVLYLDEGKEKLTVISARAHKNITLLKIKGIDSIETAETYRGRVLFIDRADAKLPEGTYFVQDIIGVEVVDYESGEVYGRISDVSATGANDVWHIAHKDGNEYLMPVIDEVVKETDIEGGRVTIKVMKGLFGDED